MPPPSGSEAEDVTNCAAGHNRSTPCKANAGTEYTAGRHRSAVRAFGARSSGFGCGSGAGFGDLGTSALLSGRIAPRA